MRANNLDIPEELPFLNTVCWDLRDPRRLTAVQMLARYNNGMHLNGLVTKLEGKELRFYDELKQAQPQAA